MALNIPPHENNEFFDSKRPPLENSDAIATLTEVNKTRTEVEQQAARTAAGDKWDLRTYRPPVFRNALLSISENVEKAANLLEIAVRHPVTKKTGTYADAVKGLNDALQQAGIGKQQAAGIVRAEVDRLQKMVAPSTSPQDSAQSQWKEQRLRADAARFAGGDESGQRWGVGRVGSGGNEAGERWGPRQR